jgi:hypothetical protein
LILKPGSAVELQSTVAPAAAPLALPPREIAGSNAAFLDAESVIPQTCYGEALSTLASFSMRVEHRRSEILTVSQRRRSASQREIQQSSGWFTVCAFQKKAMWAQEDSDMVTGLGYGRLIVGIKPGIGNGCSAHSFKWR